MSSQLDTPTTSSPAMAKVLAMAPGILVVHNVAEAEVLAHQVRASAARLQARIAALPGSTYFFGNLVRFA